MKRKGGEEQTKRKRCSVDKKGRKGKNKKKLEREKQIEGERKKGRRKEDGDFPSVLMVESRRFES